MKSTAQLIEQKISTLSAKNSQFIKGAICRFLISQFHYGDNLYHLACIEQDINLLKSAIESSDDINKYNNSGLLPIHILLREMIDLRPHRADPNKKEAHYKFNEEFWNLFLAQKPNLDLFWLKRPIEIKTVNKSIFGYPSEVAFMLFKDIILMQDENIVSENILIYEKIFTQLFVRDQKDFSVKIDSVKENFPNDDVDYFKFPSISSFMISYIAAEDQWSSVLPLLSHPNFHLDYPDLQNGNTPLHIIFGRLHAHINKTSKATIQNIILKIINNPNFKIEQISKQNFNGVAAVTLLRKESAFIIDFFKMMIFEEQLYAQTINIAQNSQPIDEGEDDDYFAGNDDFKL